MELQRGMLVDDTVAHNACSETGLAIPNVLRASLRPRSEGLSRHESDLVPNFVLLAPNTGLVSQSRPVKLKKVKQTGP